MKRRRLLALLGASAVAGCTGTDGSGETTLRDSDGDGMVDGKDYAPNDPAVQEKSDLVTTAPTTERTTTPTTTLTPTTEEATQTTTADANTIRVTDGLSEEESRIVAYSAEHVTARIVPSGPSVSEFEDDAGKLLVYALTYPRDEQVAVGESDEFSLQGKTTATATVNLGDAPTDERLHYLAFVVPTDLEPADLTAANSAYFHETNGFSLGADGSTISRDPHPLALSDTTGEGYERQAVEGAYTLSFSGTTQGTSWTSSFYIYKSSYVQMALEPRGRSRPEYVEYAQKEGFAGALAGLLYADAEANDITGAREQVEFLIDFVQNLPYVPDDVSTGFDDYTKFAVETIAEAGGDCEDTSILLAALLQADPFGYDTVLIQPPGHMAVGVYGTDLPGYYWTKDGRKYYYIETTGEGWGVGDLPETYEGDEAYVHQV